MRSISTGAPLTLLAILVCAPAAAAQTAGSPAPSAGQSALAIPPERPVVCRIVPLGEFDPDPARRDITVREFHYGELSAGPLGRRPREILFVSDSAGKPVLLIAEVTRYSAEGMALGSEQVIGDFRRDGSVDAVMGGFTIDTTSLAASMSGGDVSSIRDALKPLAPRELSAAEVRRLRVLAAHLWERRCARDQR
jgi:hypothetical protein